LPKRVAAPASRDEFGRSEYAGDPVDLDDAFEAAAISIHGVGQGAWAIVGLG
jgi:hypothetical protein